MLDSEQKSPDFTIDQDTKQNFALHGLFHINQDMSGDRLPLTTGLLIKTKLTTGKKKKKTFNGLFPVTEGLGKEHSSARN